MKQLDFKHQQLDLQDHHQQSSPRSRGRPRRQPHLIKGSVVEVSSEEEGLKGAWYEATIIKLQSFSKGNVNAGKFYVEYNSLLSDKDDSKHLRGYVSATCVRPVPPVESHPEPFNIDDLVDAYYSDGWRKGVITKIVEDNRFVVTFHNQPDVGEFGPSDLRFHREWVNGSWVPPVNQTAAGLMPNVGKRVEVSFDTGGSHDIWLPAIILEDKGSGIFYVEYHKCDGDGGSWIAKEDVDSLHIRPCPPQLKEKTFILLEKVDAFYEFGWWSGVITKELAESRYIVFFKHTKTEREFLLSELRPHMEWKDGEWSSSSKDVLIPSDYKIDDGNVDENGSSTGVTVALGSSIPTKITSVENMPLSSTSRVNAIELVAPGSDEPQVINSSPREMTLDSSYSGGKETLNGEAHAAAPSTVINASNYNVNVEILSNVASAEKDSSTQPLGTNPLHENNSPPNKVKRKRGTFGETEEIAFVRSRKIREKKVHAKTSENSVGKEGNEADGVTEDVPGDCMIGETNLPIVLGLACDNTISFGSKLSSRSNGEGTVKRSGDWYSFDETELHSVKVSTNQFEVLNGTQKKRRGRPRKSLTSASITPMHDVEVATGSEASALGHVLGTNGSCEILLDDQMKQENQSGIKNATSPSRIGGENAVEASLKQQFERHPTKRCRKRTMNLNSISKVNDVVSPNSVEGKTAEASCMTEETERAVAVSPDNTLDNQPLSKWFGDLNSPPVDSSRSSLTRCSGKTSVGHMEISKEEAAVAVAVDVDEIRPVGSEPPKLPFEKNSPIWSALESMEVFHKLPQKPHFKPLENLNENTREGKAIGLMVTFTGVVERTSKLQYDDPKASIDDFLETLLELEAHGFDVGVVRERISDLGRMKERQEKLQIEVKKLKGEMAAHEFEKAGIDEEIENIKSQIKELQGKLSNAMSLKEVKEGEMESLQSKLMGFQEGIKNIRCEFEDKGSSWL